METTAGKSILGQIAFGRLHFLHRLDLDQDMTEFSQRSREEEETRFRQALQRALFQLSVFYDKVTQQVKDKSIADIFSAHIMLLKDEMFVGSVQTIIREQGATAEHAVRTVGRSFGAIFAAMDNPYMQARAVDICDISRRVMRLLLEERWHDPLREGPAILVSNEFFPSEVMDLDHRKVLGLIARKGSLDSHAAILLRAYHIPAMAGVDLEPEWDGHLALMDGFDQRVYLDPDRDLLEKLRVRYQAGGNPAILQVNQKALQTV